MVVRPLTSVERMEPNGPAFGKTDGGRCTVASHRRLPATRPNRQTAGRGGTEMGKGQVQKSKTNKPKLSAKEKKANKAAKKAAKASK